MQLNKIKRIAGIEYLRAQMERNSEGEREGDKLVAEIEDKGAIPTMISRYVFQDSLHLPTTCA